MEKYFTLDYNPNKLGCFPQLGCYNYDLPHSFQPHLPPPKITELEFFLEDGAIFTDIIGHGIIGSRGIMISKRFMNLLLNYNLIEHVPFDVTIMDRKTSEKRTYFWLNIFCPETVNWIDYPSSKFYYTKFGFREGDLEILDYEDSKIKQKEVVGNMGTIEGEDLTIFKNKIKNLDLFSLHLFNFKIHITERLKQAIEKENLSGIEITKSIIKA